MSDNLFHDHYRIPSARAVWHNYNGGVYFVTICTQGRKHFFGEIADGKMQLSEVGQFAEKCIAQMPQHNPYAEIVSHVVMPNHIHLIVAIDGDVIAPHRVETCHGASLQHPTSQPASEQWRASLDGKNEKMQGIANRQGRLSAMIGGFKQSVTRFATQNHISFAWQTRFHDRIIRNHDEMNLVAEYVENNVARWESDKFYT